MGLYACQGRSGASENAALSGLAPGPARWSLSVSRGGGFTGMTTEYRLYNDGRVENLQKRPAGQDSLLWLRQTDPVVIADFRKQLNDQGLLEREIRESGNMITMVRLVLSDTTYQWYWSRTPDAALDDWVRRIEQFCRQIEFENR
jgi:hypothetical protein